jgi:hypothetical protein
LPLFKASSFPLDPNLEQHQHRPLTFHAANPPRRYICSGQQDAAGFRCCWGGSNFTAGPAMVVDLSASKVGKYLLATFSRPVWFRSPFILLGSRHRPHRTLATSRHHEQVLPILPTLQSHHLSCLVELCITHVIFGFRFRDYVPLPPTLSPWTVGRLVLLV